jgi:hypothetical protein
VYQDTKAPFISVTPSVSPTGVYQDTKAPFISVTPSVLSVGIGDLVPHELLAAAGVATPSAASDTNTPNTVLVRMTVSSRSSSLLPIDGRPGGPPSVRRSPDATSRPRGALRGI